MAEHKSQNHDERPDPHPASKRPTPDEREIAVDVDERAMIDSLQAELDEVQGKYKRALADYQNFQRRAAQAEREARRQGASAVLSSIVPILDNFDLALSHDVEDTAGRQVLEGVKAIRSMLLSALESHGVKLISPEPNDEFDPNRHEALMRQAAEGVRPGHISGLMQVGYALEDRVVRPAKVTIAPSEASED